MKNTGFSKLKAHRINIDTFLRFSKSQSTSPKLLAYYRILHQVKISQACCNFLKKEPSKRIQQQLGVDVILKGLMASEGRSRAKNFLSRGYLFQGARVDYLKGDPFWHCQPLAIWTDDDIWQYLRRYNVPYAALYDLGYRDKSGNHHKIKRNGCMGCATDLLFPNNHMAMLRRAHPRSWFTFMSLGMAAQIQTLQRVNRNGQMSIFDTFDPEELLEARPCYFDSITHMVMSDDTGSVEQVEFDPDRGLIWPNSKPKVGARLRSWLAPQGFQKPVPTIGSARSKGGESANRTGNSRRDSAPGVLPKRHSRRSG